jgi:Flp pilus assembly protein TadG
MTTARSNDIMRLNRTGDASPRRSGRGGGTPARLKADCGGAVYVEFLIAFLPLFFFFSSLVQLGLVQQASLVTSHAAVMGARAAMVVLPDDPNFYGGEAVNSYGGARQADIEHAVTMIFQSIDGNPQFALTVPSGVGVESAVQVKVDYSFQCRVPIGALFVCRGATKMIAASATMPNQGANYNYPGG